MYFVCGQCGTINAVKGPVEASTRRARCSNCRHEIPLSPHLHGDDFDREQLFAPEDASFARLARMALRERIMVICNNCESRMKVGKRLAGKVVKCPSCSGEIHVPFLDQEDQFDFSLLASAARQESEPRREVVEMDASDYEAIEENVLIGHGVFKITRARLLLFVTLYLVIMVSVLAGGLILKYFRDEPLPDAAVAVEPAPTTPPSSQKDIVIRPTATLRDVRWQLFATQGYRPARPGRLYCHIALALAGGSAGLELPPAGRNVVLLWEGKRYVSLGTPLTQAPVPVPASQSILRLDPREHRDATFVFELPATAGRAELNIDGIGQIALDLPAPPAGTGNFQGLWLEQPPRNLKPLLDDPIMARLQNLTAPQLHIRREGESLRLEIPAAELGGTVTTHPDTDQADVVLSDGTNRLPCILRRTHDGRLLLYLDEAPMHQITFQRPPVDEPQAQADAAETTP
jgi:hypothetical protein